MFKRSKERLLSLEVVLDALIGALVRKEVLTREDIQRQILDVANEDKKPRDN